MNPARVRYQTFEFGNIDIHIRSLRDNQQFYDPDDVAKNLGISSASWPLFGIVWPSSMVLAHLMAGYKLNGKRILEVGCGIGLSSLLLNHRLADITATDYHPEASEYLQENTELNNDRDIPFERTDWKDVDDTLGTFDLVIGSDLLYEEEHAELLAGFIDRHTKPDGEVIIVDPGRGHQSKFHRAMTKLGYSHSQTKPDNTDYLEKPFKGNILHFNC